MGLTKLQRDRLKLVNEICDPMAKLSKLSRDQEQALEAGTKILRLATDVHDGDADPGKLDRQLHEFLSAHATEEMRRFPHAVESPTGDHEPEDRAVARLRTGKWQELCERSGVSCDMGPGPRPIAQSQYGSVFGVCGNSRQSAGFEHSRRRVKNARS